MVLIFCGKTLNGYSYYRDPFTNINYRRQNNKFENFNHEYYENNSDIIVVDGKNAYQMTNSWSEILLNFGDIDNIENEQDFIDQEDNTPRIKRCRKKSDFHEIPFPSDEVFNLLLNKYVDWGGKENNFMVNFVEGLTEYSQKLI